jgi:hypothetical protein
MPGRRFNGTRHLEHFSDFVDIDTKREILAHGTAGRMKSGMTVS